MKVISTLVLALTLATSVFAQTAPRSPLAIQDDIAALGKNLDALAAELKVALSETLVPNGGDLQAALNQGGVIRLAQGSSFTGSFKLKANTTLLAEGAQFSGIAGAPVLVIPPGTDNVYISGFTYTGVGPYDQQVIQIGRNDSAQTTLDLAPAHITIIGAKIPTYRGKRAIEVNGADVKILQSLINDVYDPAGRDSQAIGILNAPCAPCIIDHNDLAAGSENILVGGDTVKIIGPDGKRIVPTGLQITNNHIWKPLTWQTDGVARGIKNLVELKTGIDVLIKGNTLDGSWRNAQDGYCMVITARSKGSINNVLIEDNTCDHVSSGFNMLGYDENLASDPWDADGVSGIVIRRFRLNGNHVLYGGRGVLALITGGVHDITFEDVVSVTTSTMFVVDNAGTHILPDATRVVGGPTTINMTRSFATVGTYGIINHSVGIVPSPETLILNMTGNTFTDSANLYLKKYVPNNTFVTRAAFDALLAAQ